VTGLRDSDWTAQWVRPGPAHPGAEEYTYVRTESRLSSSPIVRATAFVAAAHQYQLFIDGKKVAAGPSFSYPDESYYEATDVTDAMHAGATNAIGVLHHWYGPGQGRPASAPGLLAQITVLHADGTRQTIGTDGSWREHPAEWLPAPPRNDEGGFTERVDGRLQPQGWSQAGFDDKGWTPVAVIGPAGTKPFTHLIAQRTRIVDQPVKPISVRTLPSGAVIADYGAVIAARPSVTFASGVAGRPVAMHVGYVLDPDGRVSTTVATQGTDLAFSYVERAGAQTFQAYTYLGFRYLEVDAPGEHLGPDQLVAYAQHSAMPDDDAATFTSSVPILDRVWNLVRHTALYVAQEQFVDTPTREKGQFLADSFNDSQATMHAFGEQNLTWQALENFAESQARYWPDGNLNAVYPNGDGKRAGLDFTERYPEWVWQYYLETGDRATLAQLYPVVKNVAGYIDSLVNPTTGLVTYTATDGADIVDFPPAMRYGYDMTAVAKTTTNVLAADDFARAAQIAKLLGKPADAAVEQARDAKIVAAINSKLVRPDGVYVDGLEADGSPSPHAAQQSSEFALAFSVVPPAKIAAVGQYVASLGIKTGPMDGLYLLDGLAAAGLPGDVAKVLSDTKDPGWAHIVAVGGTFSWESWILSDVEGDSMSHGWGSSALVAFQTALLGVTSEPAGRVPTGPVVNVDAPSAGPARVAGRVATIAGPVDVSWQRSGSRVTLHLTVPPNATARVKLPGRSTVVGAGTYTFTST
jgi:alpha-L-rhamnosidase